MLFSASIRTQEFRHGIRPLSNSTATQRPKRLVSLLAFSLRIPRTMPQGLGFNAYFKASRFISKRLVDAKMEVWLRLESALGQFGTRVGGWLVCRSSIATYPNASAPIGTCA